MEKFKVGDKVKVVTQTNAFEFRHVAQVGSIGEVLQINKADYIYDYNTLYIELENKRECSVLECDVEIVKAINKTTGTPLTKERLLNCADVREIDNNILGIDLETHALQIQIERKLIVLLDLCNNESVCLQIPFTEEALSAQYKLFTGKELNFDKKVWKKVVDIDGNVHVIKISKEGDNYNYFVNSYKKEHKGEENNLTSTLYSIMGYLEITNNDSILKQFGFE